MFDRTKSSFGFPPRVITSHPLAHQLFDAQFEVKRDLRIHVAPGNIAAVDHEVEHSSNTGADQRHGLPSRC